MTDPEVLGSSGATVEQHTAPYRIDYSMQVAEEMYEALQVAAMLSGYMDVTNITQTRSGRQVFPQKGNPSGVDVLPDYVGVRIESTGPVDQVFKKAEEILAAKDKS